MQDTIILGNGTSKQIKTASLPNSYAEFKAMAENGNLFADIKLNADGCEVVGTPLNKLNLLTDETAGKMGNPQNIDEALNKLSSTIDNIPVDLTGIYNTQVIGYDEASGKLVPMINVARTETVVPNAIIPAPWNVEIISDTGGTLQGDPKTFGVTGATGAWSCKAEFTTAFLLSEFTNVHIDSLKNQTFFQIDFSKTADFKNIEASYLTADKSGNCDITHLIGLYYMRVTISNSTSYDATVANLYFSQA